MEWVGDIWNASRNHTNALVCVGMVWIWHKPFFGTLHSMRFTSLLPCLQLKSYHSHCHGCCHSPTTATLQHSGNATHITRASIATAKTTQKVGCCIFMQLLAHFWLLCCPLSHELNLSPQPTNTLRGHSTPHPAAKPAKTEAMVSFFNLSCIPQNQIFHHLIFQLNYYCPMICHILCRSPPPTPLPLFNTPAMPLWASDDEFVCGFWVPPAQYQFFSHWSNFQLTCSSFHCAACFPSVGMTNKSLLLPSHVHKSHGEGRGCEFSSPFYSPPFQMFSHSFFFYCYPIHRAIHPPSVNQANKVPPSPSPQHLLCGEDGNNEFSAWFYFSPISNFSPSIYSVELFLVGHTGHPLSVYQGNKSTPHHPYTACCVEKRVTLSFPLVFNFSPLLQFVSLTSFVLRMKVTQLLLNSNKIFWAISLSVFEQMCWQLVTFPYWYEFVHREKLHSLHCSKQESDKLPTHVLFV